MYFNLTQIDNGWILRWKEDVRNPIDIYFKNLKEALIFIMEKAGESIGRDLRLEYLTELNKAGLLSDLPTRGK